MSAEKRQKRFPNLRAGRGRSKKEPAKNPNARQRSNENLRRGGPGRPKGVPNKATREIKKLWQGILEDPEVQTRLLVDARRGRLAPAVLCMGFAYAYGKPKESVEVKLLEELRVVITDDIGEEPTSAPAEQPSAEDAG